MAVLVHYSWSYPLVGLKEAKIADDRRILTSQKRHFLILRKYVMREQKVWR